MVEYTIKYILIKVYIYVLIGFLSVICDKCIREIAAKQGLTVCRFTLVYYQFYSVYSVLCYGCTVEMM